MNTDFVVTPRQMKSAEEKCEQLGRSCGTLMDTVGRVIAEKMSERYSLAEKTAVILTGSGNNGGDGFAIAKNLTFYGCKAVIAMTAPPKTELAKSRYDANRSCFEKELLYSENPQAVYDELSAADFIVDCVYGTGFHGELDDSIKRLFDKCRESSAVKLSADIASGCSALDGSAANGAFTADITFALGAVKTGQLHTPCSVNSGEIILLDIGIMQECYEEYTALLNNEELFKLYPERKRISHKGTFGKLLIIAGSENCTGAAWMCANAALRTGAGLVTLCSVKEVTRSVSSTLHECVYLPVSDNGHMTAADSDIICNAAKNADAVVIGCGMGDSEDTYEILKAVINCTDCPILIDADGINSLSAHINELKDNKNRLIITPHPKEFGRISGMPISDVLKNKLSAAADFSSKYGIHVLLKDAYSVYCAPNGFTAVNMSGNAALAKGGSGDTLSGTIGGLLAQHMSISDAVRLGSYLFGAAAEKAAQQRNMGGILPSELPWLYPYILK